MMEEALHSFILCKDRKNSKFFVLFLSLRNISPWHPISDCSSLGNNFIKSVVKFSPSHNHLDNL